MLPLNDTKWTQSETATGSVDVFYMVGLIMQRSAYRAVRQDSGWHFSFKSCINDEDQRTVCVSIPAARGRVVSCIMTRIRRVLLYCKYILGLISIVYFTDPAPNFESSSTISCLPLRDPNWRGFLPDLSRALTSASCSSNKRTV